MRQTIRYNEGGAVQSRRAPRRRMDTAPSRIQPVTLSGEAYRSLSPSERTYLLQWRMAAGASGIDAVEDLMERPWPCPLADAIIGVFRSGEDQANWLVIGQDGTWVVACCSDGAISAQFDSLADALSQ